MLAFIALAKQGVLYSNAKSIENKKTALEVIESNIGAFRQQDLVKKEVIASAKTVIAAVENAIDNLEIIKDNVLYTFRSSLKAAVDLYFDGIKRNAAEEKRFAKQTAKAERKTARGKTLNYKVADKNLVDLELAKEEILDCITRAADDIKAHIEKNGSIDFDARVVDIIDYLKAKASGVVHKVTRRMAKTQALKLLDEVGIPEARKRYRQYPFEFSGGMRQRIVIAIALSANPDILICDEPTTALDVTIQSQILELINKVKVERSLSVIFITHDLGVVANMADRVAVMYAGKIVEIGTADDIFYSPAHPYTWALLASMPDLETKDKLEAIPGTPPNMIYPPKGDAFAARNKYALEIDFEEQPPMFQISDTHFAATWLLHPDAPKVDPPKAVTDRIARMKGLRKAEEAVEEKPAASKKSTAKKPATKKSAAEKPAANKKAPATAKKSTAEKSTAKKPAAKKTVKKDTDNG
ncbi:MAG: ATP-binding cassette domain-containing protein [Clostridia bacterium]|nr:ATP-binding cassette domain-containing protein [Clostridia bacterium]